MKSGFPMTKRVVMVKKVNEGVLRSLEAPPSHRIGLRAPIGRDVSFCSDVRFAQTDFAEPLAIPPPECYNVFNENVK